MTPKEIVASCYRHLRKFCHWYLSGNTYGRKERTSIPYQVSSHQNPLFRDLQGEQQELQQNKVVNLSLGIQHLNGFTIQPGERLSYWRAIRNPTSKKGYLPGMTLTQGQITEGIGGGLCQLSNLIFGSRFTRRKR